jgi:hypothetical protein
MLAGLYSESNFTMKLFDVPFYLDPDLFQLWYRWWSERTRGFANESVGL